MIIVKRTLVLYESKYDFTKILAEKAALILGPAKVCEIKEIKEIKAEFIKFEFIVLLAPCIKNKIDEDFLKYVQLNEEWIIKKGIGTECVCIPCNLNKLEEKDYEQLEQFCEKKGIKFCNANVLDEKVYIDSLVELKAIKDNLANSVPKNELKDAIDKFLKSHNTCALSTGADDFVRGTPIEYNYYNGNVYFLTEGGEKFAGILLNNNVSISVYDNYKGMNELAGMQVSGKAFIIEVNSDEYKEIIEAKKLNYNTIMKLPVTLNLIKVVPEKIEFLYSRFAKKGYDSKQVYHF